MNREDRMIINIVLSFMIVFCAIMTIFLVVKKRELSRQETNQIMNSKAALPIESIEEKNSYSISLNTIINGYQFKDNYNIEIEYRDMKFHFMCNQYYGDTCVGGVAYIYFNNNEYELFSYMTNQDNYLNHPYDLIIIRDNNQLGILKSNNLMLYNENGSVIYTSADVVISYQDGEYNFDKKYPIINDNVLDYYSCSDYYVFKKQVDIINNELLNNEKIDNSYCLIN